MNPREALDGKLAAKQAVAEEGLFQSQCLVNDICPKCGSDLNKEVEKRGALSRVFLSAVDSVTWRCACGFSHKSNRWSYD